MMKKMLFILFTLCSSVGFGQLVSSDPAFPTADAAVIVYYDAAEGNQALKDYDGDIYAHAGVITSESTSGSDWKYVVADWGENTDKAKLTKVEGNLYQLNIDPTIIEYYSVPAGETILEMAFVFRNADGTMVGKTADDGDIYLPVYDEVMSANILLPENDLLVIAGESIIIEAASNLSDSLILFVDDERIDATSTNEINATINAAQEGKHWIWIEAKDANGSVYDSLSYFIREDAPIVALPSGVHKGINYIDENTVTLVLNAPEKEYVYLIGDFNNWDYASADASTSWVMNKTADGEYHWYTLSGLVSQEEYAFQYLVDGTIRVADPYTEKVLDPWNDKYIEEETYPGLKSYPDGKTMEPVAVFQTNQTPYDWQVTDFVMPEVEDMVIYEMLIRDFVATHSYKTIADTLDYLVRLGVNVLELMPINEFEGNSSWGYNPSFYFAPDKYYGPKEDLKLLVDECHKRGIAVVVDIVLNHSFGQSPMVRMYFEDGKPAANSPWYNVDHNFTNPDAHWGYDFNHESLYTQDFVDSVNTFWLGVYNVDGFRFDFTKGFGNNIKDASDPWGGKYDEDRVRLLKRMCDKIWDFKSEAYISFEHLSDNDEETELANYGINLWGNLNHNYSEGAMGYTSSNKSDLSWISYQNRGWDNPNVVGYMESHDEERLMFKNLEYGNANGDYSTKHMYIALQRIELAAAFFFPIPGPKMIWQFGELGYDISIDFNGRTGEKPIKWEYLEEGSRKRIYDVFSSLATLKTTEPAFATEDFALDVKKAVKKIHLNHDDMNVVVLGNFDVQSQTIDPEFQNTGWWYDYFSGDSIDVSDVNATFDFAAGEYRLYTTKRLETPELAVGINESLDSKMLNNALLVYPNPVADRLFLSNTEMNTLQIIDLSGQVVYTATERSILSIDVSSLNNGLYFIYGNDSTGKKYTGKFIKE